MKIQDAIKISLPVKEAKKITGSLTRTSKMPGLSYSLPAWECKTGSKLRKIKNSVCASCYALKGNYTRYKAIKAAQYVRLEALKDQRWIAAMVAQIIRQKYFRWHDAGDIQDAVHLQKIFRVTPLQTASGFRSKFRRYHQYGKFLDSYLFLPLAQCQERHHQYN